MEDFFAEKKETGTLHYSPNRSAESIVETTCPETYNLSRTEEGRKLFVTIIDNYLAPAKELTVAQRHWLDQIKHTPHSKPVSLLKKGKKPKKDINIEE